ncbi:hypothetical protein ABPG77_010481, partial [Micractinium sp. CCAP 211/92]
LIAAVAAATGATTELFASPLDEAPELEKAVRWALASAREACGRPSLIVMLLPDGSAAESGHRWLEYPEDTPWPWSHTAAGKYSYREHTRRARMLKHEDHCRQARKELDALYKPPKALLSAAVPATRLWGMPEGWEHYAEAAQAVAVQYGATLHTLTYDWQRAYFTDGSVQKSDEGAHLVGAAVWRATGGTGGGSTAWRINPNGYGPTNTINCAEGAAVWTVLWHILEEDEHADIFTDSHTLAWQHKMGVKEAERLAAAAASGLKDQLGKKVRRWQFAPANSSPGSY